MLISVKMPTIVGILTFMIEHAKFLELTMKRAYNLNDLVTQTKVSNVMVERRYKARED